MVRCARLGESVHPHQQELGWVGYEVMNVDEARDLGERLTALLDTDPAEAVRRARLIDLTTAGEERLNALSLRARILVDGGAISRQVDAVEEAVYLLRELLQARPEAAVSYNLANAVAALAGMHEGGWLDRLEQTRELRAEARELYWSAADDPKAAVPIRTQAWTNLANQFTNTYRMGEAHDARLAALDLDPTNGVAAGLAALDLLWLCEQGGCSDMTRIEAVMLANVARACEERVRLYAGAAVASRLNALAAELGEAPPRIENTDPFIRWVENERLTLAPAVELVDPSLGKLDWLMLPNILERAQAPMASTPPAIIAMFNTLKADFILARDLAWRSKNESDWPATGKFADTLDYATYGPDAAALIFAHRTALDVLDKVGVVANHYFELGQEPRKVYFGRMCDRGQARRTVPTSFRSLSRQQSAPVPSRSTGWSNLQTTTSARGQSFASTRTCGTLERIVSLFSMTTAARRHAGRSPK